MKSYSALVWLLMLLFAPASAYAQEVRAVHVGNPQNAAALGKQVQQAYQNGARMIIINHGLYHLPAIGQPTFNLEGWKNATISAYHVTLIMRVKNAGNCFELAHCRNVTIEGPVISQTLVTFYQGHVLSTGKDKSGGYYCVWRPDTGYPFPAIGSKTFPRGFDVVNGRTRHLRVGSGDIWAATVVAAGPRTFRLTFRIPHAEFKVGDYLVARYGNAFQKVRLDNSRHCTLKDITMMRNGFAPIFENAGGANRIIACRWVLGPKPPGATAAPVVTNQADGFHCVNAYPGPDIEDCVMHGVFLDDCIAIHGEFQTVVGAAGRIITVKDNRSAYLRVGQPIQIANRHGFFATTKILTIHRFRITTAAQAQRYNTVAAQPRAGRRAKPLTIGDGLSEITLATNLTVPVGAYVTNPLRCGSGYKVIDCRIGDTRSRGMLLKGSDGLVLGNVVRGCGMAGISIGPEAWWREAGYCDHVMVENNKLIRDGKAGTGGYFTAVYVHGDGAIGNADITIRNNRFISNYAGDVFIQWARNCSIINNAMTGPEKPAFSGEQPQASIVIKNSHAIAVSGNHVTNPDRYAKPLIDR
ncbi:MAG: hypothetical protein ACP5QA_12570 [Phycisphaerae bacterium]